MAFNGLNLTPIGGNSRSGIETERNAPMGWAYSSEDDSVSDVLTAGYFDSINKIVAADQFIYASLTDNNVIFTIDSVDRLLQQVVLSNSYMQPVPDGIVTANPQTGVEDNIPVFAGDSALVIKDSGIPIVDVNATSVEKVRVEADFGAESGGSIPIGDQIKFLMMDAVFLQTPLTSTVGPPFFNRNTFESSYFAVNNIFYGNIVPGSPTTFLTLANTFLINFKNIAIFDFSNGPGVKGENTFVNLANSAAPISLAIWDNLTARDFVKIGSVSNMQELTINGCGFFNNAELDITDVGDITITRSTFTNDSDTGETFLNILGESNIEMDLTTLSFNLKNSEYAIFIDPNIGEDSSIIIENARVNITGNGEFFEPGDTGTITNIVDAGGGFVTVTSTAHGQSNNQTLLIEGTIDYDGGAKASNVTANTFDIERTFVSVETVGSWDTGSLTGTDKRVTISNVQSQPDSDEIFSFTVDSIDALVNTTMVALDTYQDINFSGETPLLDGTELFTLIDPDNGTFRYDGTVEKTFQLGGFTTVQKGSATAKNFTFAPFISINGGASFARALDVGQSLVAVTNAPLSVPFGGAVVISSDDQIKMQVQQTTGSLENIGLFVFNFVGS